MRQWMTRPPRLLSVTSVVAVSTTISRSDGSVVVAAADGSSATFGSGASAGAGTGAEGGTVAAGGVVVVVGGGCGGGKKAWYPYITTADSRIAMKTRRSI